MVTDARAKMKEYLESYVTDSNLTDENGDEINYLVMYAEPPEEVKTILLTEGVDLVFSIDNPTVTPLMNYDQTPYRYVYMVPVSVWCIDKYDSNGNITLRGTTLKWKAENEVRTVLAENPTGSQYGLQDTRKNDVSLGSDKLYGTEIIIKFVRSTTA